MANPNIRSSARAFHVCVGAAALAVGACSLTATPPKVEVSGVQLRGVGLLDQDLAVDLCVTNMGDAALAFRRVTVEIEINGAPLASGTTELPVHVRPGASTDVPFDVVTTLRNLGPQLLVLLQNGAFDYRLHGTIQLAGALPLTIGFSRSGQLGLAQAAGEVLADPTLTPATRCGAGGM